MSTSRSMMFQASPVTNIPYSAVGGGNSYSNISIGLSVWLSILIPGHLLDWGLEWGFIVMVLVLGLFSMLRQRRGRLLNAFTADDLGLVCLVLSCVWTSAYFYTVVRGYTDTGIRDYVEGLRFVFYFVMIVYIGNSFRISTLYTFHVALHVSLLWTAVCLFAYVIPVPGLTPLVTEVLYADVKTSIDVADAYYRISIPFENPNFLGFYLTMVLAYFLFFYRGVTRIPVLFLTIGLLFMTGSRSAWLSSLVVLAAFALGAIRGSKSASRQLVLLVFLVFCGTYIWIKYSDAILSSERVMMMTRAADSGGVMTEANVEGRLDMMEHAYVMLQESPFIGWGSYKYGGMDVVDSQYFIWLFRVGVIGCALILFSLGRVMVIQVRAAHRSGHAAGVIAFWGGSAAMLLSGSFLDNFRLFFIFWCFVAAIQLCIPNLTPRSGTHLRVPARPQTNSI